MKIEKNGDVRLINGDCIDVMKDLIRNGIKVDLTVTSPPYDNLRTYKNEIKWDYDIFKEVAKYLYEITCDGGIVVWIVGDATINGSETGTSFKQALYFKEIGFNLHDTMIYEKNSSSFPASKKSKRYTQIFEYMFVFSKGKIRKDINLICDKKNKWAGYTNWGNNTQYDKEGNKKNIGDIKPVPEYSLRNNIWRYSVGFNDKTGHPAVFPEKLANDHILSWSNKGDVVFDCFMGSGTTGKMAIINERKFIGIEKVKEYYDISCKRIENTINNVQLNLF